MNAVDRAADAFRRHFSHSPRWGARAPGRVNLIGEHTDYNAGLVLPIAIDRGTAIFAGPAAGASTLVATDLGLECAVDVTSHLRPIPRDSPHFFANYVLGVIAGFQERGAPVPNLDLVVASDIPIGAGLSSSASVEVAMATLLEQVTQTRLGGHDKALLCQRAEHAFPGTPCGIMDMFVSAMAVRDRALLIDCESNVARQIPFRLGDSHALLIVDTGVKRNLAIGEYADRRAACERAARRLGLRTLRQATVEQLGQSDLNEVDRKRAAHVVLENGRVVLAVAALLEGRMDEFCSRMFESHWSLRDLFEVSCPELDVIVEAAATLSQASGDRLIGARMTGAGFGGCAIILCRTGAAANVAAYVQARFRAAFDRDPTIFSTSAGDGARAVEPS